MPTGAQPYFKPSPTFRVAATPQIQSASPCHRSAKRTKSLKSRGCVRPSLTRAATDLGTLDEGRSFSRANGINAYGQWSVLPGEKPDLIYGRAFIVNAFDRSGMIELATLGGHTRRLDPGSLGGASLESDRSFALGGNARDQVVGIVGSHPIERQVSVPRYLYPGRWRPLFTARD